MLKKNFEEVLLQVKLTVTTATLQPRLMEPKLEQLKENKETFGKTAERLLLKSRECAWCRAGSLNRLVRRVEQEHIEMTITILLTVPRLAGVEVFEVISSA